MGVPKALFESQFFSCAAGANKFLEPVNLSFALVGGTGRLSRVGGYTVESVTAPTILK